MRYAARPQLQKCGGGDTQQIQDSKRRYRKQPEQHKQLMQALTLRIFDAKLMVFTLYFGNCIYQARDNLKEPGVDLTTSMRVFRKYIVMQWNMLPK